MEEKSSKTRILEYISYGLAAIAVAVGLSSVFNLQCISKEHDKALLWFGFALLAILIPYVKEVTFKDLKVVIEKIDQASRRLDGAAITAEELSNRLNATRDELINGYQQLLRSLPEDERKERVIRLSKLYMSEMGIKVSTIKRWLIEIGKPIKHMNEELDDDYLYALRELQKANGLGDDGIFGYRTLNLLIKLRNKSDKPSSATIHKEIETTE
jgi:hypothetical protein